MAQKNNRFSDDSGDLLGALPFFGRDGDKQVLAAEIRVFADGAVASGKVPARFEFHTMTSGGTLTKALTIDASQAATLVGTLTGTAGVVRTGRSRFATCPIGSVAYSSFGTNTSASANSLFLGEISIDRNVVLTGIGVLQGAQVQGNSIFALYDSTGTLVASTASTSNAAAANAFQEFNFTATYSAVPGRYWIAAISNNGSHTYRTIAASTFIDCFGNVVLQGGFAAPATITPPSAIVANAAPIAYVF